MKDNVLDELTHKQKISIDLLIDEARRFCEIMTSQGHDELVGVTDGKRIGTYIESKFKDVLDKKYEIEIGSAAKGIDFPESDINVDVKTTFITQPQSSCPFRNARQKIFGLDITFFFLFMKKMIMKKLT